MLFRSVFSLIWTRKYNSDFKIPVYIGAAYFALSVGDWIYVKIFTDRYYAFGFSRNQESLVMYRVTIALAAVKTVVLIALIYFLMRYFIAMVSAHTGRETESVFASLIEKDRKAHAMMVLKCRFFFVCGTALAVSSLLSAVFMYLWPQYWLINLAISIIWLTLTSKLTYDLNTAIDSKYL